MNLRSGFTLGSWTIYPLEGRLVGETSEQRVQPKSMDVLLYLAENAGAVVEREVILHHVWGGRAQSDEPLTRCIGELRRVLGDTRTEPNYINTIPKRGYQLLKPVRPIVGESANIDDAVPRELASSDVRSRFGALTKTGITFLIVVAAAIVATSVVQLLDDSDIKLTGSDPSTTEPNVALERTIAVLPFVPMSSGEDDGYFADGLTEEILNALTQLPELKVTARTSSFFFKGKNIPVPEIAARLNVAHIVEGSVRRDGERVRIVAQFIRASDGFQLWSQSYDRTLDDVFAVQEDIAANIADILDVVLDADVRQMMRSAGIRDVAAFIAYQKGLEAYTLAHEGGNVAESLVIANAFFDQALDAAPDLTTARVLKADRAAHVIFAIADGVRDEEYPGEAQEMLAALRNEYDQAWQLSPHGNDSDILNLERTLFAENWSRLRPLIQYAMQPGRCPRMTWTNEFIGPFGWAEQVAGKFRETLKCDPMDVSSSYELPWMLTWAGNPDAALQALDEAENKGIRHPRMEGRRYWALLAAGHVNDPGARGPGPQGDAMDFGRQLLREALAGDPSLALQMAEDYWSRPDANNWRSLWLAAVVGDRNRANELAARIDAHPGSAVVLSTAVSMCLCGAPFDLIATPNYKARIEEAGLSWPPPKRIDYPTKAW